MTPACTRGRYTGAKAVFVDVEKLTGNLSLSKIKKNNKKKQSYLYRPVTL